jgi:dTDP-4-dehydrorhamnose reductase
MRILLLGGGGQVGSEFRSLPIPSTVIVDAPDRTVLDLRDPTAIESTMRERHWDVVINAAAYTNVDRAETEEALALAINGLAATRLAAETARKGIPLIHISTDYIFDGLKGAPYVETDDTSPLNAYGRTKLAGEWGVRGGNARHVILRSSWVFSPFRTNFVRTVLRLAAERERLTIVADQHGCPTAARDIAQACLTIALQCGATPNKFSYGTYHLAGAGATNWFEFASAIVAVAADRLGRKPPVVPIRTIDYQTPTRRPVDSRLDCSAVGQTFGITAQHWRSALESNIDRILSNQ